MGTHKQDH